MTEKKAPHKETWQKKNDFFKGPQRPAYPDRKAKQGNSVSHSPAPDTKTMPGKESNIGWLFYKDYYQGIDFSRHKEDNYWGDIFSSKNNDITGKILSFYSRETPLLELKYPENQAFELTTLYPGLATGLGMPHETRHKGEYKLGFHFDHTTGLPIIPGSSVKGVLRSAFQDSPDYIKYLLENLPGEKISLSTTDIGLLEKEIFNGLTRDGKIDDKPIPLYRRDIFFDAPIIKTNNKNGYFLASDFITPHPDPFKDPVPLEFLKVLPQVTFLFQFRLFPSLQGMISPSLKIALFKRILLDLGIGAKTNVGYGKFSG